MALSTCADQKVKTPQQRNALEIRMLKIYTPLWCEANLERKCVKTLWFRTVFGSWDVATVKVVVARNTFRTENIQNTLGLEEF